MSSVSQSLALVPRDGFFCKDGRGWYTSDTNRARALSWPFPSTIRGAITTACGFQKQEREQVLLDAQEWLNLQKEVRVEGLLPMRRPRDHALTAPWEAGHLLWPAPKDVEWGVSEAASAGASEPVYEPVALVPRQPGPGVSSLGTLLPARETQEAPGSDDAAMAALWYPQPAGSPTKAARRKPLDGPAWWDHERFVDWLAGQAGSGLSPSALKATELVRRSETKVVMKECELVARDGGLYSYEVLEALSRQHQWALGVRTRVPAAERSFVDQPLTLGGKGRIMHVEKTARDVWAFPPELRNAFSHGVMGLRLILVTPGAFERGWIPPGLDAGGGRTFVGRAGPLSGLVLRAAIVPRPLHVSGWDMAKNRAKGTRRLVPPGSVYFFTKQDRTPFSVAEVEALWLHCLGDGDTVADGLGQVVPGVWHL